MSRFPPGTEITSRYRIDAQAGAGAMAEVYRATDLQHQRTVAIKVLREDVAFMLATERFLREVQLTARLNHSHILPVIDSGGVEGPYGRVLYYVTPFADGETLRQRLEREGALDLATAIAVVRDVGDALDYAHTQNVVHRDVKPENILLQAGRAVLADFGIALLRRGPDGGRLTTAGLSLGTPPYMSPEQALGEGEVDGRSDQYSLACVLYELLSGSPPFGGENAAEILARKLTEEPARIGGRSGLPRSVDAVLRRALASNPSMRYPTIGNLVSALVATQTLPTRHVRTAVLTSMVVGAIAVGITLTQRDRMSDHNATVWIEDQLTFSGGTSSVSVSPNGRAVAFFNGTAMRGGRSLILGETASSHQDTLAYFPDTAVRSVCEIPPQWNATSDQLLYDAPVAGTSGGRVLMMADIKSRRSRQLSIPLPPNRCADGEYGFVDSVRTIFLVDSSSITLFDASTGDRLRTVQVERPRDSTRGARRYALRGVPSHSGQWFATRFGLVSLQDGSVRGDSLPGAPKGWSTSDDAVIMKIDGATERESQTIERVQISTPTGRIGKRTTIAILPGRELWSSFSTGGTVAATVRRWRQQRVWLFRAGRDGNTTFDSWLATKDTRQHWAAAVSPDGSLLAHAATTGARDSSHVVFTDTSGVERSIGALAARISEIAWRPNSMEVAVSVDGVDSAVYLVRPESRTPLAIATPERVNAAIAWDWTGSLLVYVTRNNELLEMALDGSSPSIRIPLPIDSTVPAAFNDVGRITMSPNGDRIFVSMGLGDGWSFDVATKRWSELDGSPVGAATDGLVLERGAFVLRPWSGSQDRTIGRPPDSDCLGIPVSRITTTSGQGRCEGPATSGCYSNSWTVSRRADVFSCTVSTYGPEDIWIARAEAPRSFGARVSRGEASGTQDPVNAARTP